MPSGVAVPTAFPGIRCSRSLLHVITATTPSCGATVALDSSDPRFREICRVPSNEQAPAGHHGLTPTPPPKNSLRRLDRRTLQRRVRLFPLEMGLAQGEGNRRANRLCRPEPRVNCSCQLHRLLIRVIGPCETKQWHSESKMISQLQARHAAQNKQSQRVFECLHAD